MREYLVAAIFIEIKAERAGENIDWDTLKEVLQVPKPIMDIYIYIYIIF